MNRAPLHSVEMIFYSIASPARCNRLGVVPFPMKNKKVADEELKTLR
jgi:hypothetical protein